MASADAGMRFLLVGVGDLYEFVFVDVYLLLELWVCTAAFFLRGGRYDLDWTGNGD